jgi:glycosyltransferase involved in cell wall biosynthesis
VIRVVHVVVAGEIGGAERMLCDLARPAGAGAGADAVSHAVALLTPNEALARLFADAGLRVHDRGRVREGPLPFLWSTLGPRDVAWIARVLRDERATVAHLHTFASQAVGTRAALRAGVRVLRTEHSTRAFDDPSCWPFSRWSLARADTSVAISDHVRAVAVARAPWAAGKMRVIPNGIDVKRFTPREPREPPAAQESRDPRAPRAAFTFVLVGRLEPRKGVDLALDALARVPGARLEVVGDGELRGALEQHGRRVGVADRVRFLGYVADTRAPLASADAALCSSRSEGLGIALLEAMAMARPVVGFAVGGVPEVVEDGRTGWLAPAGDVEALAARMREATVSRDRARAMGSAARAYVVERHSVATMRAAYARVYREIAARR